MFGQPFGSNYTDLQNHYMQQLQAMQQAQQKTQPILDEINREVGSLSLDEQKVLAADNLLATIRKSKEHIHAQLKAKEDKVNTLLELVEQDPEIKKRLDEVMLSKSK